MSDSATLLARLLSERRSSVSLAKVAAPPPPSPRRQNSRTLAAFAAVACVGLVIACFVVGETYASTTTNSNAWEELPGIRAHMTPIVHAAPSFDNVTLFSAKLLAVYLAEEFDNSADRPLRTQHLYLNPECNTWQPEKCGPSTVQRWFEFVRPAAVVDAQLNSQSRRVRPGSYSFVVAEFCKGTLDAPNFRFAASNMSAPYAWAWGLCAVRVPLTPALVVRRGDSVHVSIDYDLSRLVKASGSESSWVGCTRSAPWYCVQMPPSPGTPFALSVSAYSARNRMR